MLQWNALFFEALNGSTEGIRHPSSGKGIVLTGERAGRLERLIETLQGLSAFFYAASQQGVVLRQCSGRLEKAQGSVFWRLFSRMGKILDKLDGLLHTEQFIYWLEYVGGMECQLCALPKQLDFILYEDLWGKEIPYILTSATLYTGQGLIF